MRQHPLLSITNLETRRSAHFTLSLPALHVRTGTKLCVTGPNGSGKSTLLEHIVGLLPIQHGSITIAQTKQRSVRFIRSHIGYIPDDESWFIPELTAQEYFALLQSVYREAGNTAVTDEHITKLANYMLFNAFSIPLKQLSHGNKKKVQIIAALMHNPQLVVVDEIRNGLDPLAIMRAEALLETAAARGAAIVAATHDLWWAERMADEILLLDHGTPLLHRTRQSLVREFGSLEQAFLRITEQKTS